MIELYKGNELHMLLVDNVNAKNMNNADMQMSYINKRRIFNDSKIKSEIFFFFTIELIGTVVGVRGR